MKPVLHKLREFHMNWERERNDNGLNQISVFGAKVRHETTRHATRKIESSLLDCAVEANEVKSRASNEIKKFFHWNVCGSLLLFPCYAGQAWTVPVEKQCPKRSQSELSPNYFHAFTHLLNKSKPLSVNKVYLASLLPARRPFRCRPKQCKLIQLRSSISIRIRRVEWKVFRKRQERWYCRDSLKCSSFLSRLQVCWFMVRLFRGQGRKGETVETLQLIDCSSVEALRTMTWARYLLHFSIQRFL